VTNAINLFKIFVLPEAIASAPVSSTITKAPRRILGVADCGMKTIVFCGENPCRDVKFYVSRSKIHTSIQQRRILIVLVQNTRSFVQNTRSFVQNTRSFVQNTRSFVQNTRSFVQNTRSFVQNTRSFVQNTRTFVQNTRTFVYLVSSVVLKYS
jgi:ElaB/YqjD/DUF883 family membrane-anchored ribosome-binding protein